MACLDSPPRGRVRGVSQVHASARTRAGWGAPRLQHQLTWKEVPTPDTPGSSCPRRKEGSDGSRPPASQRSWEPVGTRPPPSRTSQLPRSLRLNPRGRPRVAGQGWELRPTHTHLEVRTGRVQRAGLLTTSGTGAAPPAGVWGLRARPLHSDAPPAPVPGVSRPSLAGAMLPAPSH